MPVYESPAANDNQVTLIRKMLRNQVAYFNAQTPPTPVLPEYVGVKVELAIAAQNIPNLVLTSVIWDTVRWDTDGFANLGVSPTLITIPAGLGGKYLMSYTGQFSTNSAGFRLLYMETAGSAVQYLAPMGINALASPQPTYCNGTVPVELVAGDTVRVVAYQSSGSVRTLDFGNGLTSLSLTRLDFS